MDVVYKNMGMILEKDPDALDNVLERLDQIIYDLHLFIYDTEILLSESEKRQILQKYYNLCHNDLHFSSIMFSYTEEPYLYYTYKKKKL